MSTSDFLRDRAQAYADHIVAVLLIAGGAVLMGWAINHFALVWNLDPHVAMILAWVIALLVAVAVSLLLKPKRKPGQPNVEQPAPLQQLTQSGIVNAPHFEFKPHNEANQSQTQSVAVYLPGAQQAPDRSEPKPKPKLNFECLRADLIDVEIDTHTFEILFAGQGIKGKAAVAEFRRNTDDSDVEWVTIQTVAELKGRNGKALSINEGRWLDHDGKIRRSAFVPFTRLTTKRLAVVLGISNTKVSTYEGRYFKTERFGRDWFYAFREEFQDLAEGVYDVEIRLVGTQGRKVIVDDTFGFDLIRGAELKDNIFRKKTPCLLVPGVQPDKAERIRRLSDFAAEGDQIIEHGKGVDVDWPKAREWAKRAEGYIREYVSEESAAYFSLETREHAYPGGAVVRSYVDWVHTRIQRIAEIASEVRKQ